MDFEFSDTQRQIAESLSRFLKQTASSQSMRASLSSEPDGFDRELWQGLAELGVPAIAIPEQFGGLGLTDLDLCVAAEVIGRFLARAPVLSTIYQVTEAIVRYGSDKQKSRWLPQIASGSVTGAFVDVDLAGFDGIQSDGRHINGELPIVGDALTADLLVIADKKGTWLVETDQPGFVSQPLETIDLLQPSARVELHDANAGVLPSASTSSRDHLRRRGAILAAFEQVGACDSCITEAVRYAGERRAFGRAIGSFQAVKHLLANMYVSAELARSNVYYAGWALATADPHLPVAAAAAHLSATDASRRCAADALQVHGGIGFTWELDCHFRYRRANHLALMFGPARLWEDELLEGLVEQRAKEAH